MDAKICDICGATYLAPVTYREQVKNFEIKRTKFDWIKRLLNRKTRYDIEKTYGIAFIKETSISCDNEPYYTKESLDICPACSDKICEFIDTLAKENDGDHSDNNFDSSCTDNVHDY